MVKVSGVSSGIGMVGYAGGQYVSSGITDGSLKMRITFVLMTTLGVITKYVTEKVANK